MPTPVCCANSVARRHDQRVPIVSPVFPNLRVFTQWANSHAQSVQRLRSVQIGHHHYRINLVDRLRRLAVPYPGQPQAQRFFQGCRGLFEAGGIQMETQSPTVVAEHLTHAVTRTLIAQAESLPSLGHTQVIGANTPTQHKSNLRHHHQPPHSHRSQHQLSRHRHISFAPERTVRQYDPATTRAVENAIENVEQQRAWLADSRINTLPELCTHFERQRMNAERLLWADFHHHQPTQEPLPQEQDQPPASRPRRAHHTPPPSSFRRQQAMRAYEAYKQSTETFVENPSDTYVAIPSEQTGTFYFRPQASQVAVQCHSPTVSHGAAATTLYDASYIRVPYKDTALAARQPTGSCTSHKTFWEMLLQHQTALLVDSQHSESTNHCYYPRKVGTSMAYGSTRITCVSASHNATKLLIQNQRTGESCELMVLLYRPQSELEAQVGDLAHLSEHLGAASFTSIAVACPNGITSTGMIYAAVLIAQQVHNGHIHWDNKEHQINRILGQLQGWRHPAIAQEPMERYALSKLADKLLVEQDQTAQAAAAIAPPRPPLPRFT